MFRIGGPYVGRHAVASNTFSFALVFDLVRVGRKTGKLGFTDQNLPFTRGRIHVPQFTVIASIIALHEGNFRAVGTPLDVLRTTPCQAAIGEDGLNGERLGGRVIGTCLAKAEEQRKLWNKNAKSDESSQEQLPVTTKCGLKSLHHGIVLDVAGKRIVQESEGWIQQAIYK